MLSTVNIFTRRGQRVKLTGRWERVAAEALPEQNLPVHRLAIVVQDEKKAAETLIAGSVVSALFIEPVYERISY
jgi:hypothetical protein